MRKIFLILPIFALPLLASCRDREETMEELTARVMELALYQYSEMDKTLAPDKLPRTLDANANFVTSNAKWWCSGFYPGCLWYLYEWFETPDLLEKADMNTKKLEPMQYVTNDHDVGFQLTCSYGNGYRLTGCESYMDVMYTGGRSLATRFNPVTGCIKSWDFVRKGRDWQFPVIIDNMMNLELLMFTGIAKGDRELVEISESHARTTLSNHFRDDLTSFHLVDYDTLSGNARLKHTVQGLADESAWARGQSWALYGYTMMYRFTSDPVYLNAATGIANMIIRRLPEDGIPYWDYDVHPDDFRDASAAAIMASALIELSGYSDDKVKREEYLTTAEKQLRTLASPAYLAEKGTNGHFILMHSVGSLPDDSEVDVPLTYADYYFLEALLRYNNLKKN